MTNLTSPFLQAVHTQYWPTLKYLHVPHRKLIVSFSAVPGSGKTFLAKEIAERYQGVRINKDDVWDIAHPLESSFPSEDYEKLVPEYMVYLLNELSNYPNGLIIYDRSLDRHYAQEKMWADEHEYTLFLIRINISRAEVEQRIKRRHGEMAYVYLERLDGWVADFEKFKQIQAADFEFNADNTDTATKLYALLDRQIR